MARIHMKKNIISTRILTDFRIMTLVFEEDGELCFEVTSEDFDPTFDDIGSHLKIKQIQREKQDLLEALQLYYRVFFLGEEIE